MVLIYTLAFFPPITLASSPVYANNLPIIPDGSTNTGIDSAANDVPIVNIAAPNSGGLSHNKFHDYNVNPSGLVVNNATNNPNGVVQTNLAGLIVDNPNLANSGSANIILNEVTSTNKSLLNGYTEIAGRQADLIVANPNGIEMNSAGFINVSRLTAIVGSANQFNPNPNDLSFNLSGNKNAGNNFLPQLTISGLGIDVTRVAETDLVAGIMEIVSPIYGADNAVNLRSGDKEFNFNTKEVTSDNTNPGTNQPDEIAIDASNVAKVQAGQIYMIATVEGFGVKYTGDMLASRSGIKIDAKGNVIYGNAASESGNIKVKTTNGNITATGITHNKDVNSDVKLEASNDVNNQGQILSSRDVDVKAGNAFNNTGTEINLSERDFIVESKEVNNNSTIIAGNGIIIKSSDKITGSGNYQAIDNILLESADININQVSSNKNITLNGGNITGGNIIAGEKIDINASGILTNNNQITSLLNNTNLNGIEIEADSVTSQIIQADSNISINVTSALINNNLIRANNVVLVSDTLNNLGSIESLNDVNLNITTSISSNDIKANNDITLASKDITSNNIIAGNIIDITASGLFTNNNQIMSLLNDNSKTSVKINAADLVSKTIETNSNIEVTTINKASISDLIKGYNLILSTKELENNGNISSLNNINIISDIITSNNIIANNDITISSNQITNNDSIIAGNKVSITATDFLTNNNDILSLVSGASENSLIINALTLNNNKRIAANSILTINVNSLNNNTANSLIISGGDANLNITNLDNNLGTIESNDILKIRNLASNNHDAALLLSVSDTNTNISNSGNFKAKTAIDINIDSSAYEIIGKLESEGYIDITAGNITNKADIGAIDYIKLVASGYFTNGINGGDNSNIKIAANNYLDIEANNNINNYAILSAKTILSLKSLNGNINNYDGAELLASNQNNPGTSKLILEAINGAINQYSPNSVVVNGDHTITATDYTNTGRIDISGSLTMNIANNLINDIGALIYAGNNMYLNVVNDLTNKTNATIYAENDLFIANRALTTAQQTTLSTLKSEIAATSDNTIIKQKRLEIANIFDNLKINKLENISGNIESYGGDIYIAATTLTNKREYLPTQGAENEVHVWIQGVQHGTLNHHYYRAEQQGGAAVAGLINSTNNLTINAGTITNSSASIYAGNDIVLKANSVNNVSNMYRDYVRYRRNDHNTTFGATQYWYTGTKSVNGVNYTNQAHTITANIKAGNNFVGVATGDVNNTTTEHTAANFSCTHHQISYTCHNRVEIPTGTRAIAGVAGAVAEQSAAILSVEDENSQIVNGLDISATTSSGSLTYILNETSNLTGSAVTSGVSQNLIDKINGPDNQGMFQKSTNPNSPLFETRSQFVDQSKFFGSDYFYQKIGLNLTDVQTEFEQQNKRLVGDEFFQAKIIEEQLKTIRKNALLLSDSGTNSNTEIQSLLDNAADEYARLGLTANETLTQSQIDNLQKDIVWFETETINGELYVVPKIYLTKATRDSLNNNDSFTTKSTLMAMGDLQLDSDSLINSGSVIGNNVAISTTNDITNNNFSEVIADNNLDLTSSNGSIINFSKLKAGGEVSLTAANNITNTSTVKTNAANLLDSDNPAYISNGSTASNSGNISSTLFETAAIEAASFTANAGNDFSNYGANITTTSGDLNLTAGDDIRIETVELRNRSELRAKKYTKITDETKNIGSEILTSGNLAINAGNDALVKGSNILVDGNANITTGNELNIVSAEDSYYKFEETKKKGSFGRGSSSSSTTNQLTNVESNINVVGNITSDSQKNINIIASNVTSNMGDINLTANKSINILAGQDTSYSKTERNKKGTTIIKSSTDIAYDITNVHSDLNANGNIALNSGTNTNIVGANLDAGNNIDINAGDEVMVAAVADESYRYSNSTKTRSMATIAKYTGISATLKTAEVITDAVAFATGPMTEIGLNPGVAIASGMVNYAQNLAEGDLNSKTNSNVTKTKTYQLAKLAAGNNLNILSNNNVNLIGTDINGADATITSTVGDVNITNVKDSSYNKSTIQKSKTTMNSLATDVVKNSLLAASTIVTSMNMLQHPDAKKQTVEENTEAMGQKSQKQFTQINSSTDETVVASTIDVNNLTINSGRDTIITSSDINTTNNLDVNSANGTTITSDTENDSSFTLTEKKNPNVIAALSNGIVKVFGDAMPDLSFKKPDEKEEAQKEQRENDSLDHNPHSQDISVATNTDNAMINGYTISNNDPDELAYDTDLDKRTVKTKTYISSNIVSQNNIDIDSVAGNNTVVAANLTANNDININATSGETLITSTTNESFVATSQVEQDYNDISANYNRGRVSVDAETSIYEEDSKNTTTTQLASNITSGGNININTKDDINILSSNLNSNNEINLNSFEGNTNIAANKNTQNSETEIREGTLTLSAGVGHVAVDAAYAMDDTVKAAENLKKAKENLSRMKRLQKEGRATKDAVDDAKANLVVANLNVTLAGLKALAAAEKASKSTQTLGFYADAGLIRTGDKTNITSNSSQEVASNLVASNDININSGSTLVAPSDKEVGNTNIKGNVQSINSDINITSFNDTNITATKSESSSATKTEGFTQTVSLGASYGNSATQELINGVTAQISKRSGKSDSSNVNYTNTNILANSGTIKINSTNNDTNISGANVNADNIIINSGNNLNVASLQNTAVSKSKSKSIGAGGGSGSGSLNYNSNKSSQTRDWVDDQTNIVAGNNLTINTANNTDVKGALIASNTDNLLINTDTLTHEDIIDTEKQQSSGFGISTNISVGESSRNPDTRNPNQDKNYYPNGSTTLSLQNEGYEKEQITRATIGNGTINITDTANQIQDIANLNRDTTKAQEITKDTITGALNVSATVDNRLISAAFGNEGAQDSLVKTIKDGPKNLKETVEINALLVGDALKSLDSLPYGIGAVSQQITSPVTGTVYAFYENDSKLFLTSPDGNKMEVSRADLTKYYNVNGILTPEQKAELNYLIKTKNEDLTIRHNPTHGFIGDLIESGLGKVATATGTDNLIAMHRIVADDLLQRKDIDGGVNTFHSQGTIIGSGAMNLYEDKYMEPIITYNPPKAGDTDWATKGGTKTITYTNQINPTQTFNVIGPAVTENTWRDGVKDLNLNIDKRDGKFANYSYEHDDRDFVKLISAPNNLAEFGRGWYLVGQDIGNAIIGNTDDLNFSHHDASNPVYLQYSVDPSNVLAAQKNQPMENNQ